METQMLEDILMAAKMLIPKYPYDPIAIRIFDTYKKDGKKIFDL